MKQKTTHHYRHRYRGSKIREERSQYHRIKKNPIITTASRAYEYLHEYHHINRKYFIAITLDGASHLIEKRIISIGTLNQSLVHPREVFADAVSDRAAGIIIAHNHPSGQLEASHEDKMVTKRLKEAGKLMGIELMDHLIITKAGFLSFREEGLL